MKKIRFIPFVLLVTIFSCSNISKKSAFENFNPVAFIDTNKIANNYVKSYFVATLVNDQLVEMYNNTLSDNNELAVITGEIILNEQLYKEGITYSYCKDSLNNVLKRGISSYRSENKDTTNTIMAFQSDMNMFETTFKISLNEFTIIAKTNRLLDESKELIDNLVFSTKEIARNSNYIIYRLNVLNSNLEKYSINIKFNFDNSWNVSNIELI